MNVHLPVNIDHFGDREAAVWETSPLSFLNRIGLTLKIISVNSNLFERISGVPSATELKFNPWIVRSHGFYTPAAFLFFI